MTESQYLSSSTLGSIPGGSLSIADSFCAVVKHNDAGYLNLFVITFFL